MTQFEAYLARVAWHVRYEKSHDAWDLAGIFSYPLARPDAGRRIMFKTFGQLYFFGMAGEDHNNGWNSDPILYWETEPGKFEKSHSWNDVVFWCYETEEHPGIPVVRTYPM